MTEAWDERWEEADWDALLADWSRELEGDDRWVTLPEAEAEAGVSRSALRSWYRSGQVPSRLVDGPHGPQRLVPRSAVLLRASLSPRRRTDDLTALKAEVAELRARVEALEGGHDAANDSGG